MEGLSFIYDTNDVNFQLHIDKFLNNVKTYLEHFADGAEPSELDTTWFPEFADNLICSPINGDKKKRNGKKHVTMKNREFEDKSDFLKQIYKGYIHKHKVCMCSYIISQLKKNEPNSIPITVGEFVDESLKEYHDLVKMILNDGHSYEEYESFLVRMGITNDLAYTSKVDEIAELLINQEYDNILLADLFMFRKRGTFLGRNRNVKLEHNAAYTTLLKYMIEKTNFEGDEFHVFIERFNPHYCTEVREDLMDLPPRPFMDYKLSEFSNFAGIIDSGRCYSFEFYGSQILAKCSDSDFNGISMSDTKYETIFKDFKDVTIPQIARYYANLEKNDPSIYELVRRVKDLNETVLQTEFNKSPAQIIDEIKSTDKCLDALLNLFQFLAGDYLDQIKHIEYRSIYDNLGEGFYNLIGLMGYIFITDDLTRQQATEDSFKISVSCIYHFVDFVTKIKQINLDTEPPSISIYNKLSSVPFTDNTPDGTLTVSMDNLLDDVIGSCIHGVGNRLICRYLGVYNNLEKCNINVPLAPFMLPIPHELRFNLGIGFNQQQKQQWEYMTCFKADNFNQYGNNNPYNNVYFVMAYTKACKGSYVAKIITDECFDLFRNGGNGPQTPLDYIQKRRHFRIQSYGPDTISARFAAFLELPSSAKYLIDLMRIPYTFQKDRKLTFYTYKEYLLHTYCLRHNITDDESMKSLKTKYEDMKALFDKEKTIYDLSGDDITLDYKTEDKQHNQKLIRSFLTWNIKKDGKKLVYMLDKDYTKHEKDDDNKYNLIEDIYNMLYVKEGIIREPFTTEDVTRIYHYMIILEKMINPTPRTFKHVKVINANSPIEDLKVTLQLLDRYHRMSAQDLTLFNFNGLEKFLLADSAKTLGEEAKAARVAEKAAKAEARAAADEQDDDEDDTIITGIDVTYMINALQRKVMLASMRPNSITPAEADLYKLLQGIKSGDVFSLEKVFNAYRDLCLSAKAAKAAVISANQTEQPDARIILDVKFENFTAHINVEPIMNRLLLYIKSIAVLFFVIFTPTLDVIGLNQYIRLLRNILSKETINDIDELEVYVHQYFNLVVECAARFLNHEGMHPGAYQFNFTEVANDAYFLEGLVGILNGFSADGTIYERMRELYEEGNGNDGSLNPSETFALHFFEEDEKDISVLMNTCVNIGITTQQMQLMFYATYKWMSENLYYYKEGACDSKDIRVQQEEEKEEAAKHYDMTLKYDDMQDGVIRIVETMVKAYLISEHKNRMTNFYLVQEYVNVKILPNPEKGCRDVVEVIHNMLNNANRAGAESINDLIGVYRESIDNAFFGGEDLLAERIAIEEGRQVAILAAARVAIDDLQQPEQPQNIRQANVRRAARNALFGADDGQAPGALQAAAAQALPEEGQGGWRIVGGGKKPHSKKKNKDIKSTKPTKLYSNK